jgi:single-strand DNA-binding protein
MTDINHVVLVGRLTRDAELKFTNTGFAIANLSLAVNRRTKKDDTWQDEANFFDCVLLGKSAESLQQYLVKGKQIAIQGELRQDRWEQDGQRRSKVEVQIRNLQLLGGRGGERAPGPGGPPREEPGERPAQDVPTADDFDDDIPF